MFFIIIITTIIVTYMVIFTSVFYFSTPSLYFFPCVSKLDKYKIPSPPFPSLSLLWDSQSWRHQVSQREKSQGEKTPLNYWILSSFLCSHRYFLVIESWESSSFHFFFLGKMALKSAKGVKINTHKNSYKISQINVHLNVTFKFMLHLNISIN